MPDRYNREKLLVTINSVTNSLADYTLMHSQKVIEMKSKRPFFLRVSTL